MALRVLAQEVQLQLSLLLLSFYHNLFNEESVERMNM